MRARECAVSEKHRKIELCHVTECQTHKCRVLGPPAQAPARPTFSGSRGDVRARDFDARRRRRRRDACLATRRVRCDARARARSERGSPRSHRSIGTRVVRPVLGGGPRVRRGRAPRDLDVVPHPRLGVRWPEHVCGLAGHRAPPPGACSWGRSPPVASRWAATSWGSRALCSGTSPTPRRRCAWTSSTP